ncbi:MAG: hypothetical protein MI757_04265 [Pirellulales bacterium]|nr:hypothetical protein [Pirellulales bacterium]
MRMLLALTLSSLITCSALAAETLPLIVKEDFENGADRWETTDVKKKMWSVEKEGDNHFFRVLGKSDYKPPVRSPHSQAILKDVIVSDFELTARLKSTNTKAGAHRDLCLFWGKQDPSHFYYVHIAKKADPHANQIFIVDGAPRKAITKKGSSGTPWDDEWHKVKIVRRVKDGTIEVYFDDMETPHMTAVDKTFTWGQVGIGTFDDHGNWDDIELRGIKVNRPAK